MEADAFSIVCSSWREGKFLLIEMFRCDIIVGCLVARGSRTMGSDCVESRRREGCGLIVKRSSIVFRDLIHGVARSHVQPSFFRRLRHFLFLVKPPVEKGTPRLQERVRAGQVSSPAIASEPEALQGLAQGFSTLLRTDMGRSLGVSADMVAVDSVGPARGKDDEATGWGEWAQGWLNVSAVTLRRYWSVSLVGDGSRGV